MINDPGNDKLVEKIVAKLSDIVTQEYSSVDTVSIVEVSSTMTVSVDTLSSIDTTTTYRKRPFLRPRSKYGVDTPYL